MSWYGRALYYVPSSGFSFITLHHVPTLRRQQDQFYVHSINADLNWQALIPLPVEWMNGLLERLLCMEAGPLRAIVFCV